MTLSELVTLLHGTGYPVSFSHFDTDDDNPPPPPPFITYMTPSDEALYADDRNYYNMTDVDIELYTRGKDLDAERSIESIFSDNDIPYVASQRWIDGEKVFQKLYEVRLI